MGIVTANDGDFCTFHFIGQTTSTHTTANLSIKHYLKVVKATAQIGNGGNAIVVRNITLESELLALENDEQLDLINGMVDRLSEATLNKLSKGEV